MAIVIGFTYVETKGLTLEQIEKRFEGVPRNELGDITEVYNGNKPIEDSEVVADNDEKVPVTSISKV